MGTVEENMMLEAVNRNCKQARFSGLVIFGLAVLTGCCTLSAAPGDSGAKKPRPEVFDQEIVQITVDSRKKSITVEPERAEIFFQWHRKKRDHQSPDQVRWVVRGLERNQVLHIVPKEKSPEGVFPIPRKFQGRPAYSIDGRRFNSIVSGEVEELPCLKRDKGYLGRGDRGDCKDVREKAGGEYRGDSRGEGGKYTVVWAYDVIVADRNGEVLFEVDPEIVIAGHP